MIIYEFILIRSENNKHRLGIMKKNQIDTIDTTRRGMLKKLGLAAVAVYAVPVMLKLSEAHASSPSPGASASASASASPGGSPS